MTSHDVIEKEIATHDAIAADKALLHRRPAMRFLLEQQYAAIDEALVGARSMLEIGCGTGEFLQHCLRRDQFERVSGMDVSPRCVELARELVGDAAARTHLFSGDAAALAAQLDGQLFERVVMRGVVHHLETPEAVFEQAARALSSGGQLVIFEGNCSSAFRKLVLGFADRIHVQHEASQFPHTPPRDIAAMLTRLGFEDIEIRYVPGLIAPVAYLGRGGELLWRSLGALNAFAGALAPRIFGWWFLLTARKV